MNFQDILNVVTECREIKGKGSIKAKEALAHAIGDRFAKMSQSDIETFLVTLFPGNHPEKFMPIGMTTLAYIMQEILNAKQGRLRGVVKGENPFDWVTKADALCTSTDPAALTPAAVQRAIKMMYKSVGQAKCLNLEVILEACTPAQGRILCEILGCHLAFGFGIKHFLGAFDSSVAVETFVMTNDLTLVAQAIATGKPVSLTIGYYVSSMLARQKPFHTGHEAYNFINAATQVPGAPKKRKSASASADPAPALPFQPFVAQIKIDGYRVQLHVSRSSNRIWYYSRNALDLSDAYHFNQLDAAVQAQLPPSLREVILDGEVVAYDTVSQSFIPCSEMAAAPWMRNPRFKLIYFAFDLLYLDGTTHLADPYSDRLALLGKTVNVVNTSAGHHVIPMTSSTQFNGVDTMRTVTNPIEAHDFYELLVANDQEGMMLKSMDAPWTPYDRSNAHLKVKPTPTLHDLYIVGVNVNRAQMVASVLLAYEEKEQYYTLSYSGTGLTVKAKRDLTTLVSESATWSTRGSHAVPKWLHIYGDERPHMFLQAPLECQVSAHKMMDSKIYAGGKTLRFPVIRAIPAIHFDKSKSGAASSSDDDDSNKGGPMTGLPASFDMTAIRIESKLLGSFKIWVVPTSNESLMSELARNVIRLGASLITDPISDGDLINLVILPDMDVDPDMLELADAHFRPSHPVVPANWLRRTYLYGAIEPLPSSTAPAPTPLSSPVDSLVEMIPESPVESTPTVIDLTN